MQYTLKNGKKVMIRQPKIEDAGAIVDIMINKLL